MGNCVNALPILEDPWPPTAAIGSMKYLSRKKTIVYCFTHLMSSMTSSLLVDSLFSALEYLVDVFHTEDLAVTSGLPMVFHTSCFMIKPSLITYSSLPHRLCNKLAYMQAGFYGM